MSKRLEPAADSTEPTPSDACIGTRVRLHRRITAVAATVTDGGMA
ncbi:hypothetical protein [Haloterrigena sp. H1]|nr:hypothetical protein [Haloterrigena sp. H1]